MAGTRARRIALDAGAGFAEPLHPEWLEHPVRKGFWSDPQNHKRYLRWLGNRLGYKTWEDWYREYVGLNVPKR